MPNSENNELQVQIQYTLIEKLSASQQAHSQLMSLLDECIFECHKDLTLTYVNPAWKRQLSYDDDQLIGRSLIELLHPHSVNYFTTRINNIADCKSDPMRVEVQLRSRTGTYRWFDFRIVKKSEIEFIGSLFDIQDQKEMESRLRQQEEEARKLSLVASHTNNMVIITDNQGRVEWVNSSFERTSGYHLNDIKGQKPGSFLQGPLTDEHTVALMSKSIAALQAFNVEIVNYSRQGEPYWVSIDASPVFDEKGEILHFIAIESNITPRVKAEQLAAEAEYNYRLVVDNISEVVLRLRPNGSIVFMNHAWKDLVCCDEEQCIGSSITDFVSHINRKQVEKALDEFRAGQWNARSLEIQMKKQNGTSTWVEMSMTPIRGNRGELASIAATIIDVDKRVSSAIALNEAKQHAEGLANAKSRFLANISHEIRTPLNAMIGSSEILLDTGLNQEQQRFTSMIQSSGSALLSILDDVLTYSRFEAGAVILEERAFNLGACLDEAIDILSDSALKKKLKLILHIDPAVPMNLQGDNIRLRQILINLLANAIKFTQKGRINIYVSSQMQDANSLVLTITVSDTGIGIAENKISQLFEPFMQSDVSTTRKFGGSGLGLAICRQICEAVGGEIQVTSSLGNGSDFTVQYPLKLDKVVEKNDIGFLPSEQRSEVWIVGQDVDVNKALGQSFERYKIDVRCFPSINDLPRSCQNRVDFLVVTEPSLTRECRQYLQPDLAHGSSPCLITIDVLAQGKYMHWHSHNELNVNGPFKASHLARIIEQLNEMLGMPNIHVNSMANNDFKEIKFAKPNILVVEDNKQNQVIMEKFLLACDCWVFVANQGVEALKILQNEEIDLVLMDIQMPVMDGLTTTQRIRSSNEAFQSVPIIAVTADAVYGDKERYLNAGMNAYLPKPINRSKLNELLYRYLPEDKKSPQVQCKMQRLFSMQTLAAKLLS